MGAIFKKKIPIDSSCQHDAWLHLKKPTKLSSARLTWYTRMHSVWKIWIYFFFMKLEMCRSVGLADSVLNQIWGRYLSPGGNEIIPQLLNQWIPGLCTCKGQSQWEEGDCLCLSRCCLLYSSPGSDLSEQEGAGQVIWSPGLVGNLCSLAPTTLRGLCL